MNNLENNYCEECDNNNLEINFKKYKNKKDIQKKNIINHINKLNFIPINLELLPKQYCNLCNKNNHKINNCPLLSDNLNFVVNLTNNSIKKTSKCFNKTICKKSILKNIYKSSDNFDICHHFANFTLKSGKSKKVSFNFNSSTTH